VVRLNIGCGEDLKRGWVNVDSSVNYVPVWNAHPDIDCRRWDVTRGLPVPDHSVDEILVQHMLHMLTYDQADALLKDCYRAVRVGGTVTIVEADVLDLVYLAREVPGVDMVEHVLGLVSDETEPTSDGKLLRWVCWHGTRRSLWSYSMLDERLARIGFLPKLGNPEEWARPLESFVIIATV
jgi:SAM-dependent methyltransferase